MKKRKNKPGQGRPKLPYKTTQIRIPVPALEEVQRFVRRIKEKLKKDKLHCV